MRRAVVIGGSIGGLFTAVLLRRAGWEVEVYERVQAALSGRGAGIVTHPELVDVLAAAGADPGAQLGVEIAERRVFDREGNIILSGQCRQTTTSWNGVYQMLKQAFAPERYHRGAEFVGCEIDAAGVTARFADGVAPKADLLVGADGIRSAVRRQFQPRVEPHYAGYAAWRGLVDEAALSPGTHAQAFPYFTFCLPPGEQMLGYPVAGENDDLRPGRRRSNWVWYRPAAPETTLPRLLTDETGHRHDGSIPPPLIARAVIDEMRQAAERLLSPQFRELVGLTRHPFLQPIYDLASDRLAFGRAALVGDAAFVARPHVGAGIVKAARDAHALVEALETEQTIPSALARFERERLQEGRRVIEQARRLGAYMRTRFDNDDDRRLAERHQRPEAVLAETATLDFLRSG